MQLSLLPMVGAIAAGNAVVVKPSEVSAATSQLLGTLIPKYLDPLWVQVVNGGVAETTALLDSRFDKIFFTGSTALGPIILAKAAKYMTPVVLELGGKSPCVVCDDANLTNAARRIAWGKFLNCGQSCIAPDYILCSSKVRDGLVAELKKTIKEFYGENPQQSPDYPRIVNKRHFDRVTKIIAAADKSQVCARRVCVCVCDLCV